MSFGYLPRCCSFVSSSGGILTISPSPVLDIHSSGKQYALLNVLVLPKAYGNPKGSTRSMLSPVECAVFNGSRLSADADLFRSDLRESVMQLSDLITPPSIVGMIRVLIKSLT